MSYQSRPELGRTGAEESSTSMVVGMLLAVLAGVGIASQSRVNGALAAEVGSGAEAAVISFAVGWVILVALSAALPAGRRGVRRLVHGLRQGRLRPWQCLGGVFGGYLVISQGLTVGALGVALFTVAVVAGQTLSSLLVDRFGLGPAGPKPVTGPRILGAALSVVAVGIAVSGRIASGGPELLLAIIPALAGLGIAWQQAVNGRVSETARNPMSAGLVNFTAGLTALLLASVVFLALGERVGPLPALFSDQAWMYLGGVIGSVFITLAAAIVRLTGVLLFGLGTVAGQLIGALLLDLLVPTAGSQLDLPTLVGTALTLVAVAVAALRRRARPRSAGGASTAATIGS